MWLYKLIFKSGKSKTNHQNEDHSKTKHVGHVNSFANQQFKFMEDYRMWKNLSVNEKNSRLTDIKVIFDYGKEHIKKAMIKKGFKSGSKIIDISYFCGLNEFGSAIIHFLIQHENGGEIRELSININMDKMEFIPTCNLFYSNGKEKYWYLKGKNKDIMNL